MQLLWTMAFANTDRGQKSLLIPLLLLHLMLVQQYFLAVFGTYIHSQNPDEGVFGDSSPSKEMLDDDSAASNKVKRSRHDYEKFVEFCNRSSFFGDHESYHETVKRGPGPIFTRHRNSTFGRHYRDRRHMAEYSTSKDPEADVITVGTWWPKESTVQLLLTNDAHLGRDAPSECTKHGGTISAFETSGAIELLFGENIPCDSQALSLEDQFCIGLYGSKNDLAIYTSDDATNEEMQADIPSDFGFFWVDSSPLVYNRWALDNNASALSDDITETVSYFENQNLSSTANGAGVLCASMDMLTVFRPRLCEDRLRVLCMRNSTGQAHEATITDKLANDMEDEDTIQNGNEMRDEKHNMTSGAQINCGLALISIVPGTVLLLINHLALNVKL